MTIAREASPPRRRSALFRDIAIALGALLAAGLHFAALRWLAGTAATLVGTIWIIAERELFSLKPALRDRINQVALALLGALLVWRFNESRIWFSLAGIWCLVCAADLSRLVVRFPDDALPADQRMVLKRRLRHLAILGVVSGGVAGAARLLTLRVRLVAVALMALFVVMVLVRTVRSIHQRSAGDDAEIGS